MTDRFDGLGREGAPGSARTLLGVALMGACLIVAPDARANAPSGIPRHDAASPSGLVVARTRPLAIGVGTMADRTTRGGQLGAHLRDAVLAELRAAQQVVLLPERLQPSFARSLQRRHLSRYRLEGTVSELQTRREGRTLRVRCAISMLVLDDPGRVLRVVMSSAATAEQIGAGPGVELALRARAVEGAVRGVFARLLQTLSRV